jgi:dGTPase
MLLDRQHLEERERRDLAAYAVRSADSRGRVHAEPEHLHRTAFQRDRDRIVRSTAFRRLEYKTQVFLNHEGDHFRTRLTHTIEVVQIARTLTRSLGLNEDLTEAIALAHDLGHTPFGHSGEEALRDLMADHGGFEHNAHGLRVVELLERPYEGFPGLNLSYEVREGMAKHQTRHDLPTADGYEPARQPALEAQVVEIADAIAYDSHDLDDGLTAGMIDGADLKGLRLWQMALDHAGRRTGRPAGELEPRRVVKLLIDLEAVDFLTETEGRLAAAAPRSADAVRDAGRRLAAFSPHLADAKAELERFLMQRIYRHYRVARMMTKARRFLEELFRAYRANPLQLPPHHQARIPVEGLERTVCDYMAGMTDRYAQDEYLKLFSPFEVV